MYELRRETEEVEIIERAEFNEEAFRYYRRLEKVRDYLERNISEPLPVIKAASIAGLHPKYFSVFFREKTGIRFRDWVHHVRIGRAAEIIRARNRSLSDVAALVGYRDLGTFERAFKRCLSMTPRAFKESVRPRPPRPEAEPPGGLTEW